MSLSLKYFSIFSTLWKPSTETMAHTYTYMCFSPFTEIILLMELIIQIKRWSHPISPCVINLRAVNYYWYYCNCLFKKKVSNQWWLMMNDWNCVGNNIVTSHRSKYKSWTRRRLVDSRDIDKQLRAPQFTSYPRPMSHK